MTWPEVSATDNRICGGGLGSLHRFVVFLNQAECCIKLQILTDDGRSSSNEGFLFCPQKCLVFGGADGPRTRILTDDRPCALAN